VARRKAVAVVPFLTGVAVALTLFACCCPGGRRSAAKLEPEPVPPIGLAHFDVPREALPAKHTQAEMQNVRFHVDRTIVLNIHALRGEMFDKNEGQPLNFDDKRSFVVHLASARIGVDDRGLSDLMNHYVFNYAGAPLRDLIIHVHEGRMVQEGVMHKLIDIPFEMTADVTVTDDGWLRIHPLSMRICNLNGEALMKAFGITLDEILKKVPPGVRVAKNDLLIDALALLPPPTIRGRITAVELHENELLQVFDDGTHPPPLGTIETNGMLFRGGTLRMGKLFMVRADMEVLDTDPRDPFDFFVDYYNAQLTAGYDRNTEDYGLRVYMRDFEDVGKPLAPGERHAE
jgi:hypothetical protein